MQQIQVEKIKNQNSTIHLKIPQIPILDFFNFEEKLYNL